MFKEMFVKKVKEDVEKEKAEIKPEDFNRRIDYLKSFADDKVAEANRRLDEKYNSILEAAKAFDEIKDKGMLDIIADTNTQISKNKINSHNYDSGPLELRYMGYSTATGMTLKRDVDYELLMILREVKEE